VSWATDVVYPRLPQGHSLALTASLRHCFGVVAGIRIGSALAAALAVTVVVAAPASAAPRPAAVERALEAGGFYAGKTMTQVAFTQPRARRPLGSRTLRIGARGFDVAELELALAWQGFPSGTIDGAFGGRLRSALIRFQRASGLRADGVAGSAIFTRLRRGPRPSPIPLGWPLLARVGDRFGVRAPRFHAGIDLPAPAGTGVIASAPGKVTWAAPRGGWGNLVTVDHGHGVRTMYAHLARIDVRVGQWIAGGTVLGRVGSTGDATGPHLHFEVRVAGAAVDPLQALLRLPAAALGPGS
jgi:murein DD-endopeptidase MepM/ murein hydrolase activator NlpD